MSSLVRNNISHERFQLTPALNTRLAVELRAGRFVSALSGDDEGLSEKQKNHSCGCVFLNKLVVFVV